MCSILGRSPAPSPVLGDVLLALSSAGNHPDWSSPDALDVPITLFHLSRVIDQAQFDSLLQDSSDLCSKAIILSTSIQHAGDWLHVVPSTKLGLHLKDWEFRLCLRYWLGIQLVGENSLCPICGCQSDTMGTIMSHVEEMLTSFLDITVSVMSFLLLPVQPHCHLGRNCQP